MRRRGRSWSGHNYGLPYLALRLVPVAGVVQTCRYSAHARPPPSELALASPVRPAAERRDGTRALPRLRERFRVPRGVGADRQGELVDAPALRRVRQLA